jgi:hypothetical protein
MLTPSPQYLQQVVAREKDVEGRAHFTIRSQIYC